MAYDTTYALGKGIPINTVFNRIRNLVAEPRDKKIDNGAIIETLKMSMLKLFTEGREALRNFYITPADVTVSSGVINVSTLPFIEEIVGLSYPGSVAGEARYYRPVDYGELVEYNDSRYTEKADERVYTFMQGKLQIRVQTTTDVSGESSLELVYVRSPMVDFTYGESLVTTNLIDIVPTWVPYLVYYTAWDLAESEGYEKTDQLRSNYPAVVERVNALIAAGKERRKEQKKLQD